MGKALIVNDRHPASSPDVESLGPQFKDALALGFAGRAEVRVVSRHGLGEAFREATSSGRIFAPIAVCFSDLARLAAGIVFSAGGGGI